MAIIDSTMRVRYSSTNLESIISCFLCLIGLLFVASSACSFFIGLLDCQSWYIHMLCCLVGAFSYPFSLCRGAGLEPLSLVWHVPLHFCVQFDAPFFFLIGQFATAFKIPTRASPYRCLFFFFNKRSSNIPIIL